MDTYPRGGALARHELPGGQVHIDVGHLAAAPTRPLEGRAVPSISANQFGARGGRAVVEAADQEEIITRAAVEYHVRVVGLDKELIIAVTAIGFAPDIADVDIVIARLAAQRDLLRGTVALLGCEEVVTRTAQHLDIRHAAVVEFVVLIAQPQDLDPGHCGLIDHRDLCPGVTAIFRIGERLDLIFLDACNLVGGPKGVVDLPPHVRQLRQVQLIQVP